jgi:hypothetical protein
MICLKPRMEIGCDWLIWSCIAPGQGQDFTSNDLESKPGCSWWIRRVTISTQGHALGVSSNAPSGTVLGSMDPLGGMNEMNGAA